MNDATLLELIERYLEGASPEAERLAVEKRLSEDAGFRAEVELQRAIQEHLGDPGALRLHKVLASVVAPPQAKPAFQWTIRRGFRFAAIAAALLVLIVAAWWALQLRPVGLEQPVAEMPAPDTPAPRAELPPAAPLEKSTPAQQTGAPRQFAQADPVDFVPNPTLDARIGGIRGPGDLNLRIESPAADANISYRNGAWPLVVRGTVHADSSALAQPLYLFVYSNKPEAWAKKQPVLELPILPELQDKDRYRIKLEKTLRQRPGLYYLVIGQQRGPDKDEGYRTVWVSRFTLSGSEKN